MRRRLPALRTLPSRTVPTFSRTPTTRKSTCFPLKVNAELRAATWRFSIWERALMISSVIPSTKNSFSASVLMLMNGSTAIDASGAAVVARGREGTQVDGLTQGAHHPVLQYLRHHLPPL